MFTNQDPATTLLGGSKNKFINSMLSIWQVGTTFNSIASGTYTADGFVYTKSGSMVHNVVQETAVLPTVAECGIKLDSCIRVSVATGVASLAAGDFTILSQRVEGPNFQPLAERPFSLSFWVRATIPGIYSVAFRNNAFSQAYVGEYTVNASNIWERKVISVPAYSSAATGWLYTPGSVGCIVSWTLAAGANQRITPGSWQNSGSVASTNQVNGVASTNNFYLAMPQLELGSASRFTERLYQDDLRSCQRYYQDARLLFNGNVSSGGNYVAMTLLPTPMRTTPSVTGASNTNSVLFANALGILGVTTGVNMLLYEQRTANGTGIGYFDSILNCSARL